MNRRYVVLGAVGLLVAGSVVRYVRDRRTPRVDYESIDRLGDVEIRRYPPTVVVETVAPTEQAAFWRLFRYISGENRQSTDLSMTAPVETDGVSVPMTAPVKTTLDPDGVGRPTDQADRPETTSDHDESEPTEPTDEGSDPEQTTSGTDGVRMAFFLPDEYDFDTAPRPTAESVRLVERPERTLAVLGFSWFTTPGRVARKTEALLTAVTAENDRFELAGDPFLLRYDGPGVAPFLRTNEVAVEIRRTTGG